MNTTKMFDGMFGRVKPGLVRLDMNGNLAVRTAAGYKAYSPKSQRLINCDQFVFDIGEECFFVIPTNNVVKGDIILAIGKNGERTPKYVMDVTDAYLTVVNYEDGVVENILPERHTLMGETYFYGKVVSMVNFNGANGQGGFENILKLKMMSEFMGGENKDRGNGGMGNLMEMAMMASMFGNGGFANFFNFENMFGGFNANANPTNAAPAANVVDVEVVEENK